MVIGYRWVCYALAMTLRVQWRVGMALARAGEPQAEHLDQCNQGTLEVSRQLAFKAVYITGVVLEASQAKAPFSIQFNSTVVVLLLKFDLPIVCKVHAFCWCGCKSLGVSFAKLNLPCYQVKSQIHIIPSKMDTQYSHIRRKGEVELQLIHVVSAVVCS